MAREDAGGIRLGVIPDRVFALEYADQNGQSQRAYFFLEADRGTMPVIRKRTVADIILPKTTRIRSDVDTKSSPAASWHPSLPRADRHHGCRASEIAA